MMTECAIVVVCGYQSFDAKSQSREVQRYLMTRKFFPNAEANLSTWAGTCYSESYVRIQMKSKKRKESLDMNLSQPFPASLGPSGFLRTR